jgi:tetratricopeptide (TPR) repeat protein
MVNNSTLNQGDPSSAALTRDGTKQEAYYDSWDKFAAAAEKSLDEQEKRETEENEKALGIDHTAPKSEAQKQDLDKHHALKEAKKTWQKRKQKEEDSKKRYAGLVGQTITINPADVGECIVVEFSECKECVFTLPGTLKLVKVFIVGCDDACVFNMNCRLLTSHVEISHSNNLIVNVTVPLATLQADICNDLTVNYGQNCMREGESVSKKGAAAFPGDKVYHASCKQLTVNRRLNHTDTMSVTSDYTTEVSASVAAANPEEQQFVTHVIDSKLTTEAVKRIGGGIHPVTQRELAEKAASSAGGALTNAEEQQCLATMALEEQQASLRQAETFKADGNGCFKEKEYAQAAVHYTQALLHVDLADGSEGVNADKHGADDSGKGTAELYHECHKLRYVTCSNRAACFLKLGQPEKAVEDAKRCTELNPGYCKGQFRYGLALHALGRFPEAIPALERALEIEPKNKQIKVAIGFAEMKARKMMQC